MDIANKYGVSSGPQGNLTILMMRQMMTKEEALVFAAWIVAVADDAVEPKFPAILQQVMET